MDGYNLSTVLKRLEAAASRLEDILVFSDKKDSSGSSSDAVEGKKPSVAAQPGSASPSELVSPRTSVKTSDKVVDQASQPSQSSESPVLTALAALSPLLDEFVNVSTSKDALLGEQATAFKNAVTEMQKFVETAVSIPKPAPESFAEMMGKINENAQRVDEIRSEANLNYKFVNNLAAVASGVPALGWVVMDGKNAASEYIGEILDSATFYTNRALKDSKDERPWVQAFIAYLNGLKDAVKSTASDGIPWNSAPGASASSSTTLTKNSASTPTPSAPSAPSVPSAPSAPSASGSAPPPPPPPPSVEQLTADLPSTPSTSSAPAPAGGMSGVFSELSQGESVASKLRPSSKATLKETKPPVPRSTKPKLPSKSAKPAKPSAASAPTAALKPRIELDDTKWHIEDLNDKHDIEISAELGQSVLIDNCTNCTIKIDGKAATFSMSRCKKVGLLVDRMVASCDIVNCSDFGIQVTGQVPSLMLDQSANGAIYLSEESVGLDIVTSQCTAINVNIPDGAPGAFKELSLGEQIVHTIVNGVVHSDVVKHA